MASKARVPLGVRVLTPRPQPAASRSGSLAVPSRGTAPPVTVYRTTNRVRSTKPGAVAYRPAPPLLPRVGKVLPGLPATGAARNRAEADGHLNLSPAHTGGGPLLVPAPPAGHAHRALRFTPSDVLQLDADRQFQRECGFGVNETTIAQSTDNPNLLVAGATRYYDNSGNCRDSDAGVYYSSDGGQHWRFQVMPGLLFPSSGDPGVTYDPVRHVFLYSFVEFNRSDDTQGRIGVEVSSDGVNWSRNTTLDSSNSSDGVDKPWITVDQNPGSPHYGRVVVVDGVLR